MVDRLTPLRLAVNLFYLLGRGRACQAQEGRTPAEEVPVVRWDLQWWRGGQEAYGQARQRVSGPGERQAVRQL